MFVDCRCWWTLTGVVESAVNLTTTMTSSPVNLAMPRLLSVWEASVSRQTAAQQVPGAEATTWGAVTRPQRPVAAAAGPRSSQQTARLSSWSGLAAGAGSSQTPARPRGTASTSLTAGAPVRQLQPPATTTASDSIPPLRIARPQHLQAQMKQALNPVGAGAKLNVVRSPASGSSTVTLKASRVAGSSTVADTSPPPAVLHAAKSAGTDQSSALVPPVKASVAAERRPSSDTMPLNTLKVDSLFLTYGFSCPGRAIVLVCVVSDTNIIHQRSPAMCTFTVLANCSRFVPSP